MTENTDSMIIVNGLRLVFDGRAVIDGIDLAVGRGETLAILGKNGSGKTVILKALAGLINEYEGEVIMGGRDLRRLRTGGWDGRPRLAYVFQKGGLFDSMNLFDNVAFGLRRIGVDESAVGTAVNASIGRVGLRGSEDKLPSELSGGMQKRAGLARAVCMNPEIILFDDPTAGLDPILSDSIADLIIEIRDTMKTTCILVTQNLEVAAKVADRVALLYGGRIVFQGGVSDFFSGNDPFAKQFIGGEMDGPIDIF